MNRISGSDKSARILDLGFGSGWFLAACLKPGDSNLFSADFGMEHKEYIRAWARDRIPLHEIHKNIGEFLSERKEPYDFIPTSRVIEHVPKYSLLWMETAFTGL